MKGKSSKGLAINKEFMTTKQLAEILGVDISTVKKTVKRLESGGEVLHHLTTDKYNNKVFEFDEQQASIIKQEIQKHHNLNNRQIDNISTEAEIIANFTKAAFDMKQLYESKIAYLNGQLEIASPKANFYDSYCDSKNLSEIELLGEKTGLGKKNIFKILVADKVTQPKFVDGIKFYQAYAYFEKYFKSIPVPFELPDGVKKNRDKLMLTQEGMIYFQKRYSKTV